MIFKHIKSSELPEIDHYAKECINAGQWFLFKIANQSQCEKVTFFLKVEREIYHLDKKGSVLSSFQDVNNLSMEELFYFEDIPKPKSLSNQFLTYV